MSRHKDAVEIIHEYGVNSSNRDIFISGKDDDGEISYKAALDFIKNFRYLNSINTNPINIHILSPGGDWVCGMAIYDAIISSKSYVSIVGYGEVASMATVILQAADHRVITENCEMLLHYGSLELSEGFQASKSFIKQNEKWAKKMVDIYARKAQKGPYFTDQSLSKIKKFFNYHLSTKKDWWMSAQESLEYGLIDEILSEKTRLGV